MCNGANLLKETKQGKIRLERGADVTPAHTDRRDLLVHEIWLYVKESVPMNVATFAELIEKNHKSIINHIAVSIFILILTSIIYVMF